MHASAADQGVDTMLSGWGGDEAASFNGRSYYAELLRRGRLLQLISKVRRRRAGPRSQARFLWDHALTPNLPDDVLRWANRRLGRPDIDRIRALSVNAALAQELGVAEHVRHPLRTRPTTRATQLALLHHGHLAQRLEEWSADASRFGITYSHPLLDRRVLEVALAAPSEAFLHDGQHRWVFRRAVDAYLPEVIVSRSHKQDSFVQRRQAFGWPTTDPGMGPGWVVQRATRMVAEGEDLGGTVDLDKLRRAIARIPEGGYSGQTSALVRAPLISATLAANLAEFVEHNRISVD
jgi:asparagine synthase (glutamine-hydrolysing)